MPHLRMSTRCPLMFCVILILTGATAGAQSGRGTINIFNRKYFSNPVTAIANPNFGNVISLTGEPRQGQIGLRFEW